MSKPTPISIVVASNRWRQCEARLCKRTRAGMSKHCKSHRERQRMYGHPEGKRTSPPHYQAERDAVGLLFAANPAHPGVQSALTWIAELLERAAGGDKAVPASVHLARLHRQGVDAKRILVEMAALWLYAMRYPNSLPDDQRLTFSLAVATLYLAPRESTRVYRYRLSEVRKYRTANQRERKELGEALRRHLARLFVNIVQAVEQREQAAKDAVAAMGVPFNNTIERQQ